MIRRLLFVLLFLSILPECPSFVQVPEVKFLKCKGAFFCEVENLCLSKEHGIFGVSKDPSKENFPKIHTAPLQNYFDMTVKVKAVSVHDIHTKVAFFEDTHLAIIGTYIRHHLIYQMTGTAIFLHGLTQFHGLHCKSRHLLALDKPNRQFAVPMDFLGFSDVFYGSPRVNSSAKFPIAGERGRDILNNLTYCYSYATLGTPKLTNMPSLYESFRETALKFFLIPKPSKPKKDLVVICQRRSRSLLNQKEMVDFLEELGFETRVVDFARVNFKSQVASVVDASYFFGPHGNGNTHILWLTSGAAFFEFFGPSKYGGIGYSGLAQNRQLIYTRMDCTHPGCVNITTTGDPRFENMLADLSSLKIQLEGVRKQINSKFFS